MTAVLLGWVLGACLVGALQKGAVLVMKGLEVAGLAGRCCMYSCASRDAAGREGRAFLVVLGVSCLWLSVMGASCRCRQLACLVQWVRRVLGAW